MTNKKVGRNDPCPCGSGKKYKKCCLNKIPVVKPTPEVEEDDELVLLMEEGDDALRNKENTKACDIWLEVWDKLQPRFKRGFKNISDAEQVIKGFNFLFNWTQDLEMELGNAGRNNSEYYKKRIKFCDEFCTIFPDSDENIIHNMKRAIGESNFAIGNIEEGETCFINLIKDYPNNIWSYIAFGDVYCYPDGKKTKADLVKAEEIYTMALGKNLQDEEVLLERLNYISIMNKENNAK